MKKESLNRIKPASSGLEDFDRKKFEQKLEQSIKDKRNIKALFGSDFYPLLSLFLLQRNKDLDKLLSEDPSLIASNEIKALKILNQLSLKSELKINDVFPFSSKGISVLRKVSEKLSSSLIWLYAAIKKETSLKLEFNLFEISHIIPEISFEYARYILENKEADKYELLLTAIDKVQVEDFKLDEFSDLDSLNKEIEARKTFIHAFYYRTVGDEEKAEAELVKYRDIYKPDTKKQSELVLKANQNYYRAEECLTNWDKVLEECDAIQDDVLRLAGLEKNTCEYFQCSDCCSNTFPTMSKTEFDYLYMWLEKNNYPINEIKEKSEAIQKDYESKHGERLGIIDKAKVENNIRGIENPHNYKFSCPFLKDGGCSCYPARPLLCRGFGLSSDNDVSVKTCQYYLNQYQANSDQANKRYAYDLRQAQMLASTSDRLNNEGKHLKGTIVAWFSQKT